MNHKTVIIGSTAILVIASLAFFFTHGYPVDMSGSDKYYEPTASTVRSTCLQTADQKAVIASKDFQNQANGLQQQLNSIGAQLAADGTPPQNTDIQTLAKKYGSSAQIQQVQNLESQYNQTQNQINAQRVQFEVACK